MKTVLVSACLLGLPCWYDGGGNLCPAVLALGERVQLVPICPEQMGGLPTPRPPAERLGDRVVNRTGADVTEQFRRGGDAALELARRMECCAAILKARSPSCGVGAVYDGSFSGRLVPGNGVAAQRLLDSGIPVFTEDNLEKFP